MVVTESGDIVPIKCIRPFLDFEPANRRTCSEHCMYTTVTNQLVFVKIPSLVVVVFCGAGYIKLLKIEKNISSFEVHIRVNNIKTKANIFMFVQMDICGFLSDNVHLEFINTSGVTEISSFQVAEKNHKIKLLNRPSDVAGH